MRILAAASVALALLLSGSASAQPAGAATQLRVRGTVDKLDGDLLTVTAREGDKRVVQLAPDLVVSAVLKRSLADVKPGDVVGMTSVQGPDGKPHAVELHIFPKDRPPTNVGQFAWDLLPNSLMTNAPVTRVESVTGGSLVKVTYQGGSAEIVVGPEVPIVTYGPGDKSLLKPGAAVSIQAVKKADGSLATSRITAEKDGVKPVS
jgi:hypothetical protein